MNNTEERFLAHTYNKSKPDHENYLDAHSDYVARKAAHIAEQSKFKNKEIAYYAGLFHDLGKINPYYQSLFSRNDKNTEYDRYHAPYSGWIAEQMLEKTCLDRHDRSRVMTIIYGHHTKIKKTPGASGEYSKKTKESVKQNWNKFKTQMIQNDFNSTSYNNNSLGTNFLKYPSLKKCCLLGWGRCFT